MTRLVVLIQNALELCLLNTVIRIILGGKTRNDVTDTPGKQDMTLNRYFTTSNSAHDNKKKRNAPYGSK